MALVTIEVGIDKRKLSASDDVVNRLLEQIKQDFSRALRDIGLGKYDFYIKVPRTNPRPRKRVITKISVKALRKKVLEARMGPGPSKASARRDLIKKYGLKAVQKASKGVRQPGLLEMHAYRKRR